MATVVPLVQIACISGNTWDWRAGWTLGPRYLSPMLPLLALPAALGIQHFPRLGIATVVISVCLTGLGAVVNATPRYRDHNEKKGQHKLFFFLVWEHCLDEKAGGDLGRRGGVAGRASRREPVTESCRVLTID